MDQFLISVIIPTLNEEEKIQQLIESVFAQKYRPIELIIVDGGSSDDTQKIINVFAERMHDQHFVVKLYEEKNFGNIRSPANARNIGLENSNGKYICFLDADFYLNEKDLLGKVKKALDVYPWVGIKVRPIIDGWLEKNIAFDNFDENYNSSIHLYFAIKHELVQGKRFNSSLGIYEDKTFFKDLGVEAKIIDSFCERHYPHTLSEYKAQRIWYGKTSWKYINISNSKNNFYYLVISPVKELFVLILAILIIPINLKFALIAALFFIILLIRIIKRTKFKSVNRFFYVFFTIVVGSSFYLYGLLKGFIEIYLRRRSSSSRD